MKTTLIRGCDVIAEDAQGSALLRGGDVVIEGDRIAFVGRAWPGVADEIIEAAGKVLMPGLVSTHAHISAQELQRSLVDTGERQFLRSGFLHFTPARRDGRSTPGDAAGSRASMDWAFAALLSHGVTTVLAFGPAEPDGGEAFLEAADEAGIRLAWSPTVSGGGYWLEDDGRVTPEIDEAAGLRQLDSTMEFAARHKESLNGRLSPVISLDEYYASTSELRRACKQAAREIGAPFTLHFLEQHREFFETMARTGRTPVELLAEEGVLDPTTILGHCIYVGSHKAINFPLVDDIAIMGASGVSVAHSPVAFARRGICLESFDRYRDAGVNMTMGTDTYPFDGFAEMRMTAIGGKTADFNYEAAGSRAVFDAATKGGAHALGRNDLGRIEVGAKADLVLVDPHQIGFGPNLDVLKGLVHLGGQAVVENVWVDGLLRVSGGRYLGADIRSLADRLDRAARDLDAQHASYDVQGRTFSERFPHALPEWIG